MGGKKKKKKRKKTKKREDKSSLGVSLDLKPIEEELDPNDPKNWRTHDQLLVCFK